MLSFLLAVHLLDLSHLSLLIDVLIRNHLRFGLDLLHSFHQSALLSGLRLFDFLARPGVVFFNLFLLSGHLFLRWLVMSKIVLLLVLDKPTGQFPWVFVERVSVVRLVKYFGSLLFPKHFLR